MGERTGSVYLPVQGSEKQVLGLCARGVTTEKFLRECRNHYLAEKGQGYQIIGYDCVLNPNYAGVFVFEGANLEEVAAALAKKWGQDRVELVDKHLRIVLEMSIPEGFTDEDLLRAIGGAIATTFPNHGCHISVTYN